MGLNETAKLLPNVGKQHSHIPDIKYHYMFVLAICQPHYYPTMMGYSTQQCGLMFRFSYATIFG